MMELARQTAAEARSIGNWDVHEAKRTLFARLVWALEDVDSIAQVNAMNMADFSEMREQRDAALAVIEQVQSWAKTQEVDHSTHHHPEGGDLSCPAEPSYLSREGRDVAVILDQSPASALAKVKAEAWDEGADAGFDNAGLPTPQWAQNPYREQEADRV